MKERRSHDCADIVNVVLLDQFPDVTYYPTDVTNSVIVAVRLMVASEHAVEPAPASGRRRHVLLPCNAKFEIVATHRSSVPFSGRDDSDGRGALVASGHALVPPCQ